MSYNQTHFSTELNVKIKEKLDSISLWQSHVLDYLIKYLVGANWQSQLKYCECFLQLLAKIRFNLESINILLPQMYDDYRFKASINVLYRAIVDDIINCYYLYGFVVIQGDPEQHALNNELNIFHKEFLISSVKGVNSEREFEKLINEIKEVESGPDIDVENEFRKSNPDLFNELGKWKKNSEIRATTPKVILDRLNPTDNGGFISETKKLEYIKIIGVTTHHNINALFKYLSQYQHYSPKAHELLLHHIEYDVEVYQRCLGELVMLLDQLHQFLVFAKKDDLKKEWDVLAPLVFDSFSKETLNSKN
jgi:hypothetical protein